MKASSASQNLAMQSERLTALTRTVRVALHGMGIAGPFGEVKIAIRGVPDHVTGYLLGIHHLDELVQTHLAPVIRASMAAGTPLAATAIATWCRERVSPHLPAGIHLAALCWTPNHAYSITWSPDMPNFATVERNYHFAASHRLHCAQLSDAENARIFGKCNSASGHGHNYRLEVSVRVPIGAPTSTEQMDAVVERVVLKRWDHTHLNIDTPDFKELNPSVENIAAVCHGLLERPLKESGAELARVRVWETEKTSATYPA